jgi:alpha-L-fucosidase
VHPSTLQKGEEALLKAGKAPYARKYPKRSGLRQAALGSVLTSLLSLPLLAQSVPPQDLSTASEPAAQIDEAWQKASAQYDQRRDALLATVQKESVEGPFQPDWQSLAKYQAPEWYRDAKFGIFIHWGLYSVPAFGSEWYPREMYLEGSKINQHHVATYGPLTKFGYKDFIPMFKAEKFDPQAWAALFKESGARYVVPVFEHHDGFAMYDSDLSDWTAKKMGPHRDLVGELATAVRAQGMHLGASSHRIEHDWFLDGGRKQASDVNDPKYSGRTTRRWRKTGPMCRRHTRTIGLRGTRRSWRNIIPI